MSTTTRIIPLHQPPPPPSIFVVVRPPPGSNELNLQIQLLSLPNSTSTSTSTTTTATIIPGSGGLGANPIVVAGRSRSSSVNSRVSIDSIGVGNVVGGNNNENLIGESGNAGSSGMVRSGSIRSLRSNSASSTTSMGGSNRTVTPLYNLEFHALTPTLVTDAGTDTKIAKFLKRGVEISQVAILDPIDLASSTSVTKISTIPLTPTTSSTIISTTQSKTLVESSPTPSTSSTKNGSSFLSKFKRMSFKPPTLPTLSSPFNKKLDSTNPAMYSNDGTPIVPLFKSDSNTPSQIIDNSNSPRNSTSIERDQVRNSSTFIRSAGRGKEKKRGYIWTVRKWLRKDLINTEEGIILASSVRFEWQRGPKPSSSTSQSQSQSQQQGGDSIRIRSRSSTLISNSTRPNSRPNSLHLQLPAGESLTTDPNKFVNNSNSRPRSMLSINSINPDLNSRSTTPNLSDSRAEVGEGEREVEEGEEEEEESDSEDSERSWNCTLFYTTRTTSTSGNNLETRERKIQLASFIPALHHPKLVGRLAVPISLSPITLFPPSTANSNASSTSNASNSTGVILTVEEMKDLMFVTVLWLIVRENLAGVGKGMKKKGMI